MQSLLIYNAYTPVLFPIKNEADAIFCNSSSSLLPSHLISLECVPCKKLTLYPSHPVPNAAPKNVTKKRLSELDEYGEYEVNQVGPPESRNPTLHQLPLDLALKKGFLHHLPLFPAPSSSSLSPPRSPIFSIPFFTLIKQPCSFNRLVNGVLACIPGKSFAAYTVTTPLVTLALNGTFVPDRIVFGSKTISTNLNRYRPVVRHDRSGKQKKQPSTPRSSLPTKGLATSVPISRLC